MQNSVIRILAAIGCAGALLGCNDPPVSPGPVHLKVLRAPPEAGVPGWLLADTIRIQVVDAHDSPRAGVFVTWAVTQGGGQVSQTTATTDESGVLWVRWTLGPIAGNNRLQVKLEDDSTAFDVLGTAFRAEQIASAYALGCGLVDGAIWCWGDGFSGSTTAPSEHEAFGWRNLAPGLLNDSRTYTAVSVSAIMVCGLDVGQSAYCTSTIAGQQPLTLVPGLPPVRQIRVLRTSFTGSACALAVSDSTAWCWPPGGTASQVPGSPAFTTFGIDGQPVIGCGLKIDSTAACWGSGPLGDGGTTASAIPVTVAGGHHFAKLVVGWGFACGVTAAREAWCWGKDFEQFNQLPTPILVPTLAATGVIDISTGEQQVQARTANGYVRWFGAGYEPGQAPTGLDGILLAPSTNGDIDCLQSIDGEIYCHTELFDFSSLILIFSYSPVQPLRRFAAP